MSGKRPGVGMAVVASAVLALSLVISAPAEAGFKNGKYAGTTTQGHSINFKVTELSVKKLTFTIDVACDDGTIVPLETTEPAKAPISDRGRFHALFTGDITAEVKGKVTRRHAAGKIESSGVLSETGAMCSGTSDWTADKQK
jgi:hypothetical protein